MKKEDDSNKRSVWEFMNDEQETEMLEPITAENCGEKLRLVREISGQSRRELGSVIGVSESTIKRLEVKQTTATNEFLHRLAGLAVIGHAKYSKMSEAEKETLSVYIGATGGIATGVGGAIGVISASGAAASLSAAGITSGLAAIGGGTILGGLAVVASIPLAVGAAGYGLVKGIKAICKANKLSCEEVDGKYEIVPERSGSENQ